MSQRTLPLGYDVKNPPSSMTRCLDRFTKELIRPIEYKPTKVPPKVLICIEAGNKNEHGAWGAVLICGDKKKYISGLEKDATANRMYLQAVIEGLQALKHPSQVKVITSSEYVQKGASIWMKKWMQKNKKIKHQDLWDKIAQLMRQHQVTFEWVRSGEGCDDAIQAKGLVNEALRYGSVCPW